MFNFFSSSLINITILWLDRVTEYYFFYDKTSSVIKRFVKKRRYKKFVLTLIWTDFQLMYIESIRDFRECWTDHVSPDRFYWYCWEDAKWFAMVFFLIKLPTIFYLVKHWNYFRLNTFFVWDFEFLAIETSMPYRILLYIYEGNCALKKVIYSRPCYKTDFKFYWFFYKLVIYYITWGWVLKNFITPFIRRVFQRGLDKFPESDREYEWDFGYYLVEFYKYFHLYFCEYVSEWRNIDWETDLQHVYGGLYDHNTGLYSRHRYDRDYLLWRFKSFDEEKPDIRVKVMKRDKAKTKWKKTVEFYEETDFVNPKKENIIIRLLVFLITNVVFLFILVIFVVLRTVLTPVKWAFKLVEGILIILWRIFVYIMKLDL